MAKEREPERVGPFEEMLASEAWEHDLEALIPDDGRSPEADD